MGKDLEAQINGLAGKISINLVARSSSTNSSHNIKKKESKHLKNYVSQQAESGPTTDHRCSIYIVVYATAGQQRPPVLSSRLSTYLAFQAPDTKRTERAQSVRLRSAGAFQEQLQREQAQEGKKKKENQAHHHGDPVISAPAVALELNSGMAALCAWKQHRLGEVDGDRGKNIPGVLASQFSHSIISRLSESLSQSI